MKIEHRAALAAKLVMQHCVAYPESGGCTAHSLSRYIGCSPQTVTNTLLRYGRKFGLTYIEVPYRQHYKRLWFVKDDRQFIKATVGMSAAYKLTDYKRGKTS